MPIQQYPNPATQAEVNAKATGAASSTDNAIARFDGVTGKIIQNSGVTIDDSANITTTGKYRIFNNDGFDRILEMQSNVIGAGASNVGLVASGLGNEVLWIMNDAFTGDGIKVRVNGVVRFTFTTDGGLTVDGTNTAAGTTGAQTINKMSGSVNFAAAATTLVVTNSLCTTTSKIFCTILTNDTTALIKNVIPASGSFTIRLNVAPTAETRVGFWIIN